jgi:hypothetical protein
MKYTYLANFHAKKLHEVIALIEDLASEIAIHTVLLLTNSNDREVDHWKKEIQTWLTKIKNSNKVKTPSGKLSLTQLSGVLYEQPLGLKTDIKSTIQAAISKELNLAPNEVDISKYNLDNYQISLGAIYDDYVKYISGLISIEDLKSHMNKYYLYED